MPVGIAEYLGQRTDVDAPQIRPSVLNPTIAPTCPFMGGPCSKLVGQKSYPPVCSVRSDSDQLFVVCSDRLVPAKSNVLTSDHLNILGQVASCLFPDADDKDVGFRRQVGQKVGGGKVYLDYVMRVNSNAIIGRQMAIVEIQGGGETSNTGTLSKHVDQWTASTARTNEYLRKSFPKVGLIPDNAWKRQLRQVFRKAPLASRFGGGFALVMGPTLFDYVLRTVPNGMEWYEGWEVALIELVEVPGKQPGPIPFSTGRALFMSYQQFISDVTQSPLPDDVKNPFLGTYTTMVNSTFTTDGG